MSMFRVMLIKLVFCFGSDHISPVCGDDEITGRRTAGGIPQVDEYGQAAHVCRDGECTLCISAIGEALRAVDYDQS